MATETEKQTSKKIPVSAKIPQDVKDQIMEIAKAEDRSLSQVVTRLLASHPELKTKKALALQS